MAAAAPAAPAPAALTDAARGLLLQWLQARCQQQKHTSFELLVDRVQALHTDSITRLDAVRIARLFMADADVRLVSARAQNAGGSDTDIE